MSKFSLSPSLSHVSHAGDIGWNKPIYFRLFGTEKYLSFDPHVDDEPGVILVNSSSRNSPDATFMLVPFNKVCVVVIEARRSCLNV